MEKPTKILLTESKNDENKLYLNELRTIEFSDGSIFLDGEKFLNLTDTILLQRKAIYVSTGIIEKMELVKCSLNEGYYLVFRK